ncbi:Transketolase, thiamine diphosphate binding domain-containing protein [Ochromonadaceae sp. CCMP2298]|nr:Transketolase, thiamine diphosphate binding domain-containing protein [Ochromonadaceae sp. CCMP2298]
MASFDENVLETRCVDTVRVLSADMVEKANSGHPGAPMGCAPIAHVLFDTMTYTPSHPEWFNRDRFVLSNGHSCALYYSMLHLTGYGISMDDLKAFRQFGSVTPGHPENAVTLGVEVSTGPLGQGLSNAVGMALAERHMSALYNKPGFPLVDHYTYVLCGDGCLQEGITSEASSLAGHQGLGKLIVLYDDNCIQIDGDTALTFTEDVGMRYEAYNWHVQTVSDGNDTGALRQAVQRAREETGRPSIIKVRTVIGFGSSKAGTGGVHGAPLGTADIAQVKTNFGFDPAQSFQVPAEVQAYYTATGKRGAHSKDLWEALLVGYKHAYPDLCAELTRRVKGELPEGWMDSLPGNPEGAKAAATRVHSSNVLNALAVSLPELVGGSADLSGSNLTFLKCSPGSMQKNSPECRYVHFGVREHAMAAICNGMMAHGGVRPFCATFLNFIGYALGAVRVSALSELGVLYIMTHDSIGLGEDGPTHQPVEMLETLRAIPNLLTLRPADQTETKGCYAIAMQRAKTPSVISLSRQATPYLPGSSWEKVALGAYVLHDLRFSGWSQGTADAPATPHPTLVLVGTGTELALAAAVGQALIAEYTAKAAWVRVVSMPCTELFDEQPVAYQMEVFPKGAPVMSIEASGPAAWRRYAHAPFGINAFGLSAPADSIYKHFGFDIPNLLLRAKEVVAFYSEGGAHPYAPSLVDIPRFPEVKCPYH